MIFAGTLLLFQLGIALLWVGAEWLVRGSAALGRSLGISPLVVGLTIVACATSMPEMIVSLWAALYHGSVGLALGNVVGSNIANVGLVLGLCAVVRPIVLRAGLQSREVPIMIGLSIIFLGLGARQQTISRVDGVVLLALLVIALIWMVRTARREETSESFEALPDITRVRSIVYVVVGLGVLLGGAHLMTMSGVKMARILNVPEVIIGLTMVALGTSLPELAASLVSVARGHPELAFGNVVGSNLFNISFVAGTVATIKPLPVSREMMLVDMPIMLAFSVAMYLLMCRRRSLGRAGGMLLLAGYLGFLIWIALTT